MWISVYPPPFIDKTIFFVLILFEVQDDFHTRNFILFSGISATSVSLDLVTDELCIFAEFRCLVCSYLLFTILSRSLCIC